MNPDTIGPRRTHREGSFFTLLIALLVIIAAQPFVAAGGLIEPGLHRGLFTLMMIASIFDLRRNRRELIVACILILPAGIATTPSLVKPSPTWDLIYNAAVMLFCIYMIVIVIREIVQSDKVTLDILLGAVCVYLLLAIVFALLYTIIYRLGPEAFNAPTLVGIDSNERHFETFLYFSVVTISTLGYGDVTPTGGTTRYLACFEAVIGQFYLALLVARLVTLYVSSPREPAK